jgi:hypothetical protein
VLPQQKPQQIVLSSKMQLVRQFKQIQKHLPLQREMRPLLVLKDVENIWQR